jgi:hypothetical protein
MLGKYLKKLVFPLVYFISYSNIAYSNESIGKISLQNLENIINKANNKAKPDEWKIFIQEENLSTNGESFKESEDCKGIQLTIGKFVKLYPFIEVESSIQLRVTTDSRTGKQQGEIGWYDNSGKIYHKNDYLSSKHFVTLIEICIQISKQLDLDYVFFGSWNPKIANYMDKYQGFQILDPSKIETGWSRGGLGREGTIPRILHLKKS